jgi:hypothetical protein
MSGGLPLYALVHSGILSRRRGERTLQDYCVSNSFPGVPARQPWWRVVRGNDREFPAEAAQRVAVLVGMW